MRALCSCYAAVDFRCMFFFFFQAEDGIRDLTVTGVQTCALPISMLYGCRLNRSTRVKPVLATPNRFLTSSRPPLPGKPVWVCPYPTKNGHPERGLLLNRPSLARLFSFLPPP